MRTRCKRYSNMANFISFFTTLTKYLLDSLTTVCVQDFIKNCRGHTVNTKKKKMKKWWNLLSQHSFVIIIEIKIIYSCFVYKSHTEVIIHWRYTNSFLLHFLLRWSVCRFIYSKRINISSQSKNIVSTRKTFFLNSHVNRLNSIVPLHDQQRPKLWDVFSWLWLKNIHIYFILFFILKIYI